MQQAQEEFGYSYQNDHSYPFYIALCYLQLNQFEKAQSILQQNFDRTLQKQGESWIHYLDFFYMGVIHYELRDYAKAIESFDKALAEYSKFPDAQYYKGLCYFALGDTKLAESIMRTAKANAEQGYTINEDDVYYETYPYQVNRYRTKWTIPNYKE